MSPRNPIKQYYSISFHSDKKYVVIIPFTLSIVLTFVLHYGNLVDVLEFIISIVPVISSILIGFLGTIIIASLSDNLIFNKMREMPVETQFNDPVSMYRIFFIGLYFNLVQFIILLSLSLVIGTINISFSSPINCSCLYFIELVIILFLIFSASFLFLKNIDHLYQVTTHYS